MLPWFYFTQRQLYTVVTVFDKPFSQETRPITLDGEEYCPTPSVPCLRIPESVLENAKYSSGIIREVFQGMQKQILSNHIV